jgi:hypothetical protein
VLAVIGLAVASPATPDVSRRRDAGRDSLIDRWLQEYERFAVAAWKEAGAEFGWIRVDEFNGAPRWESHQAERAELPKSGSVFSRANPAAGYSAAVRFKAFPSGKLRSLPGRDLCIRLWLDGSGVKDDDLREVALLTELKWLTLYRSEVSDAGLKHLTGLKQLRRLGLHDTKVADEGMKHVARLTELQVLGIGATQVTDAGLKELGVLKRLTLLDLAGTRVTDAGMKTVSGFQEMQALYVSGPAITDAAVDELAGLSKLRLLLLGGTQITMQGMDRLRSALPGARIP